LKCDAWTGIDDDIISQTIISQESTLFEGTIRSNLDPTGQHSDHELWDVLRRVGMSKMDDEETVKARYVTSLDAAVTAGAENFSHGERQLVNYRPATSAWHLD
jgi:ABC-type multidrug transport system fused ATPase/permease subunit